MTDDLTANFASSASFERLVHQKLRHLVRRHPSHESGTRHTTHAAVVYKVTQSIARQGEQFIDAIDEFNFQDVGRTNDSTFDKMISENNRHFENSIETSTRN